MLWWLSVIVLLMVLLLLHASSAVFCQNDTVNEAWLRGQQQRLKDYREEMRYFLSLRWDFFDVYVHNIFCVVVTDDARKLPRFSWTKISSNL